MTIKQKHHWSGKIVDHTYKGRILKGSASGKYCLINLHKNKTIQRFLVHRLVAEAFIPKINGKDYINHKDNNPENNKVDNLEWCTQSENIQYAYIYGNKIPPNMKKINQFDLEGNFIKTWESQTEIQRKLNIYQSNIYKVCSGKRKQTGGFIWKYAE